MSKIFVVDEPELSVHSVPGTDATKTDRVVKKGQRLTVLDEADRPQVHWLRTELGWVAQFNKATGDRFGHIEPLKAPVIEQPAPFDWKPYLVIGGMIAVLLLAAVSCSMNIGRPI